MRRYQRPTSCRRWAGPARESLILSFPQFTFVDDHVLRRAFATDAVLEFTYGPPRKQRGDDASHWEIASGWSVADPLSDLELVKTRHSSRCHTGPTNAKPADEGGLIAVPARATRWAS